MPPPPISLTLSSGLGLYPGLHSAGPTTDRLSHCTAYQKVSLLDLILGHLSPAYSLVWYLSEIHFNVLFFRVICFSTITVLTWWAVNFNTIFRTLNVFL